MHFFKVFFVIFSDFFWKVFTFLLGSLDIGLCSSNLFTVFKYKNLSKSLLNCFLVLWNFKNSHHFYFGRIIPMPYSMRIWMLEYSECLWLRWERERSVFKAGKNKTKTGLDDDDDHSSWCIELNFNCPESGCSSHATTARNKTNNNKKPEKNQWKVEQPTQPTNQP